MAAKFSDANKLLDYYAQRYQAKYRRSAKINRFRDKWGADDVCRDIGLPEAKLLIDYYLRTGMNGHPLSSFFSNYDTLIEQRDRQERDKEKIAQIMKETKKRVSRGR